MENPPSRVILPTRELLDRFERKSKVLSDIGLDVRLVVEATLVARNRADDNNLTRVGLETDIFSAINEELCELIPLEQYSFLSDDRYFELLMLSNDISVTTYFFIKDVLTLVLGDLDDYQGDIVCEDWLHKDLVISFSHR